MPLGKESSKCKCKQTLLRKKSFLAAPSIQAYFLCLNKFTNLSFGFGMVEEYYGKPRWWSVSFTYNVC